MTDELDETTVRVLYEDPSRQNARWQPELGDETEAALKRAFGDAQSAAAISVREEAVATLSNCLPPDERNNSLTGLVIGYVQSGKTLAFTVLSALARDNGFPLIIILTGTIKNLFRQSTDRLRRDLGATEGGWRVYTSDDIGLGAIVDQVAGSLNDWHDEGEWVRKETVVITVLKNGSHLDRVADLLQQLRRKGLLERLPALVIDDEADQAGLNTLVRKQDESPTYRRILNIRDQLPQYSYLQYTATPQAILLVSLMDELSPEFVQLLTPGAAYTGGQTFFRSETELIKNIPASDVACVEELRDHPPDSLREALASFVIAAANGAFQKVDHRSMLVHPHRLTEYHAKSVGWLTGIIDRWRFEAELPEGDPDRESLEAEFKSVYDALDTTAEDLAPWDKLREAIPYVLRKITVHELNTRSKSSTDHVKWDRELFTILVGGQKLDRGYTVRGLTTTYMPRSLGVGNADTVQQRARWFGYKQDYLGQCRVYVRERVARAYRRYVDHEESIREELSEVMRDGGSMAEWRRRFFLDRDLKPTRSNVVGRKMLRGGGADWFVTGAPATTDPDLSVNRRLIEKLRGAIDFRPYHSDPESGGAHHLRAEGVAIGWLLSDLILDWKVSDGLDSAYRSVMMLQLQHGIEQSPGLTATVYLMRPELWDKGGSRRQVVSNGRIENVFQGRSAKYPGDRYLESADKVVVQLHVIQMMDGETVVERSVPVLAVHVPSRIARDWIAEVPE